MIRGAGCILAVAAALVAAVPLCAQVSLDAAAVRARVAGATGNRPPSERIVSDISVDGLDGTETEIRSGGDYRVDRTLGPFHTAHGIAGGVPWSQDENGQTVTTLEDSERNAVERADDAGPPRVAFASTPSGGYVITQLNGTGLGTIEYVDPAWHVVREDRITGSGTVTTVFDDFRKTGNYTRPWHETVATGDGRRVADRHVRSDETTAIPAADLALPPSARALVEFPSGNTSVGLPVTLEPMRRRFVVRVTVGNRGLDFVLDTGASHISLDRDVAEALGLHSYGSFLNGVNAGRYIGTRSVVPEMRVGSLVMHDVEIETIPHVEDEPGPIRIVGLLGFDFFNGIGLRIDYRRGTVTAIDRSAIAAPEGSSTIALDVRLGSHQPETSVAINGARGDRFALDTGGAGAVLIAQHFATQHPEALVPDPSATSDIALRGIGGRFAVKPVRVREMLVGNRPFDDFDAYRIDTAGTYTGNQDGLIGPDFLGYFSVFTDYPDRKIYLTPNDPGKIVIGANPLVTATPAPPIPVPTISGLDPLIDPTPQKF